MQKDDSIIRLLDKLRTRLGSRAFDVVDHWAADPHAVGIAPPENHEILVYISTSGQAENHYFVGLELPPTKRDGDQAHEVYTWAGDYQVQSFDELVEVIRDHFKDTELVSTAGEKRLMP